jgi:hypothetical protein
MSSGSQPRDGRIADVEQPRDAALASLASRKATACSRCCGLSLACGVDGGFELTSAHSSCRERVWRGQRPGPNFWPRLRQDAGCSIADQKRNRSNAPLLTVEPVPPLLATATVERAREAHRKTRTGLSRPSNRSLFAMPIPAGNRFDEARDRGPHFWRRLRISPARDEPIGCRGGRPIDISCEEKAQSY